MYRRIHTMAGNQPAIRPQRREVPLDAKLRVQKQYFDRRINKRDFDVGDSVLWLRPHRTKLQNVWQGPYRMRNLVSGIITQ
jgi:hypothetical protein